MLLAVEPEVHPAHEPHERRVGQFAADPQAADHILPDAGLEQTGELVSVLGEDGVDVVADRVRADEPRDDLAVRRRGVDPIMVRGLLRGGGQLFQAEDDLDVVHLRELECPSPGEVEREAGRDDQFPGRAPGEEPVDRELLDHRPWGTYRRGDGVERADVGIVDVAPAHRDALDPDGHPQVDAELRVAAPVLDRHRLGHRVDDLGQVLAAPVRSGFQHAGGRAGLGAATDAHGPAPRIDPGLERGAAVRDVVVRLVLDAAPVERAERGEPQDLGQLDGDLDDLRAGQVPGVDEAELETTGGQAVHQRADAGGRRRVGHGPDEVELLRDPSYTGELGGDVRQRRLHHVDQQRLQLEPLDRAEPEGPVRQHVVGQPPLAHGGRTVPGQYREQTVPPDLLLGEAAHVELELGRLSGDLLDGRGPARVPTVHIGRRGPGQVGRGRPGKSAPEQQVREGLGQVDGALQVRRGEQVGQAGRHRPGGTAAQHTRECAEDVGCGEGGREGTAHYLRVHRGRGLRVDRHAVTEAEIPAPRHQPRRHRRRQGEPTGLVLGDRGPMLCRVQIELTPAVGQHERLHDVVGEPDLGGGEAQTRHVAGEQRRDGVRVQQALAVVHRRVAGEVVAQRRVDLMGRHRGEIARGDGGGDLGRPQPCRLGGEVPVLGRRDRGQGEPQAIAGRGVELEDPVDRLVGELTAIGRAHHLPPERVVDDVVGHVEVVEGVETQRIGLPQPEPVPVGRRDLLHRDRPLSLVDPDAGGGQGPGPEVRVRAEPVADVEVERDPLERGGRGPPGRRSLPRARDLRDGGAGLDVVLDRRALEGRLEADALLVRERLARAPAGPVHTEADATADELAAAARAEPGPAEAEPQPEGRDRVQEDARVEDVELVELTHLLGVRADVLEVDERLQHVPGRGRAPGQPAGQHLAEDQVQALHVDGVGHHEADLGEHVRVAGDRRLSRPLGK
ncbi:hypothetical protein GCM10007977_001290 [Dactylosporangium sucinum]|uniref:Uncharacterized protein n=1 Tax=Dactylosporangium sucinum TaxID=1424081 RepID=A0A917WH46_9ACTN|nr:hypothetical protein GCM10007977_001290 [Dactylosporangium sucinum]